MADKDLSQWSTPNIPASSASYVVHASDTINAPAALVFRTIRNTETWKDWSKFIPKVTIKKQPQEDEATDAEFAELVVLNTSMALSADSDIQSSFPSGSSTGRLSQSGGPNDPRQDPTYRDFLELNKGRRGSYASTKSNASGTPRSPTNPHPGAPGSIPENAPANGTASPKRSLSHSSPPTDQLRPIPSESLFSSPAPSGGLTPAPPSSDAAATDPAAAARRGSLAPTLQHHSHQTPTTTTAPHGTHHGRRKLSITSIYGELSVRLIVGTQLTLFMRPKLPAHPGLYKELAVIVTEVSRPPDPTDDRDTNPSLNLTSPAGQSAPLDNNTLHHSHTHTTSTQGTYRVVWTSDAKAKFLLHVQRVWEITPKVAVAGDGNPEERCVLRVWECGKGMTVKGSMGERGYLQERFEETVRGLGGFCESLGGRGVERRDFSVG